MNQDVPLKKLLYRIGLRFFLILGVVLFVVLLLPPLLDLFLPFILAFAAASLLTPLVRKFTKKVGKVWNFWSMLFVLLLILAVTGLLTYLGYYLFSQVSDLLSSWQQIQSNTTGLLETIADFLERNVSLPSADAEQYLLDLIQKTASWLTDKISSWVPNVVSGVGSLASGIVSFLISLLFFVVGAYFMTSDYPHLRESLTSHVPETIRPHVNHIRAATGTAMFGYMKAQAILSGVVTIIIFVSLLIWGQDYALLIAIFCGFIDIIPFFGSGTVLVPWAIAELFLGHYPKVLFLLILAFVLFMFRKLAEPKVVGNHTGLSPLASLISIYVGMKIGGVLGMIFVPILCMVVISLHGVGFFDPTIADFKMLLQRMLDAARITPPESGEPPKE